MPDNRLVIASAGSGKTTYLVEEALKNPEERVLITTYTEANEAVIRQRILSKRKSIPSNVTVQTWFTFLIQHGVKPYQGSIHNSLFKLDIKGLILVSEKSGKRLDGDGKPLKGQTGHPIYWPEASTGYFYFTRGMKIYSDKLSKFVFRANEATNGKVIDRLSKIFDRIYIDEVQDLAGFDLEFVKLLLKSDSKVLMVGDPRQVTYLTHHAAKHGPYKEGRIKEFLEDKCKSLMGDDGIDTTTLLNSHRNNQEICDYSSKLYPELPASSPCACSECRVEVEHKGVFLVRTGDVDDYLNRFKPIQLRWDKRKEVNPAYPVRNLGESKGETYDRVIIYPTSPMIDWMKDNSHDLKSGTRAKFYVGITRAKHSSAIVYDFGDDETIGGCKKFTPKQS